MWDNCPPFSPQSKKFDVVWDDALKWIVAAAAAATAAAFEKLLIRSHFLCVWLTRPWGHLVEWTRDAMTPALASFTLIIKFYSKRWTCGSLVWFEDRAKSSLYLSTRLSLPITMTFHPNIVPAQRHHSNVSTITTVQEPFWHSNRTVIMVIRPSDISLIETDS